MIEILYIEKISNDFYFVQLTDGSTAVLPEDSKILKEFQKKARKAGKKNEKSTY